MASNPAMYRCERCGACCTQLFVYARAEDVVREPRIAEKGVPIDCHGTLSLKQTQWRLSSDGPCPFFTPRGCAIYSTRPRDCLGFLPGSAQCTEARETAGLKLLEPMPAAVEWTLVDRICAAALLEHGASGDGKLVQTDLNTQT